MKNITLANSLRANKWPGPGRDVTTTVQSQLMRGHRRRDATWSLYPHPLPRLVCYHIVWNGDPSAPLKYYRHFANFLIMIPNARCDFPFYTTPNFTPEREPNIILEWNRTIHDPFYNEQTQYRTTTKCYIFNHTESVLFSLLNMYSCFCSQYCFAGQHTQYHPAPRRRCTIRSIFHETRVHAPMIITSYTIYRFV